MKPKPAWKPILEGPLAERAREAVRAIAGELREEPKAEPKPEGEAAGSPQRDLSLAGGKPGLAVFFAYLAQAEPDANHEETAFRCLQESIDGLPQLGLYPSLYSGLSGVAWATEHLAGRVYEPGDEDPNEEIDEFLNVLMTRSPWPGDYDVVSGLVGYGLYALERLSRPKAKEVLEKIVQRLDEIAEKKDGQVTWLTSPTSPLGGCEMT